MRDLARSTSRSPLTRVASATFALGASLDLLYHLAPTGWLPVLTPILGADGAHAHLVTFLGMLLVLATVVRSALAPPRQLRSDQGGDESIGN